VPAWCGLLLAAGCSADPPPRGDFPPLLADGGSHARDDGGAGGDGGAAAAPDGGLALLEPSGTWLLWSETVTCVHVMNLSLEGLSERLVLVRMEDLGGGAVGLHERTCQILQTPILGLATSIPLALVEAIPEQHIVALPPALAVGAPFPMQGTIELWGVQLEQPADEALPSTADDPRVYDMDGDGKPGVTLVLGDDLCEMQVVQRGFSRWEGRIVAAHRIQGGGSSVSEQKVLHASSGFCASSYDVEYVNDRHRFALLRVDGRYGAVDLDGDGDGAISCAEVRAHGYLPFAPQVPDNARCAE